MPFGTLRIAKTLYAIPPYGRHCIQRWRSYAAVVYPHRPSVATYKQQQLKTIFIPDISYLT